MKARKLNEDKLTHTSLVTVITLFKLLTLSKVCKHRQIAD